MDKSHSANPAECVKIPLHTHRQTDIKYELLQKQKE